MSFFFILGNCDFELDICGWTVHSGPVSLKRAIMVCGFRGNLNYCRAQVKLQSTDPWKRRKQIPSTDLNGTYVYQCVDVSVHKTGLLNLQMPN